MELPPDNSAQCLSLFLGDLSCFCTDDDIFSLFYPYGEIASIRLKRSKTTNKCLGYGFVTFIYAYSALAAMELNGSMFLGRKLRYDFIFLFFRTCLIMFGRLSRVELSNEPTKHMKPYVHETVSHSNGHSLHLPSQFQHQELTNGYRPEENSLNTAQIHFSYQTRVSLFIVSLFITLISGNFFCFVIFSCFLSFLLLVSLFFLLSRSLITSYPLKPFVQYSQNLVK
jgi:hypothetical protein